MDRASLRFDVILVFKGITNRELMREIIPFFPRDSSETVKSLSLNCVRLERKLEKERAGHDTWYLIIYLFVRVVRVEQCEMGR